MFFHGAHVPDEKFHNFSVSGVQDLHIESWKFYFHYRWQYTCDSTQCDAVFGHHWAQNQWSHKGGVPPGAKYACDAGAHHGGPPCP